MKLVKRLKPPKNLLSKILVNHLNNVVCIVAIAAHLLMNGSIWVGFILKRHMQLNGEPIHWPFFDADIFLSRFIQRFRFGLLLYYSFLYLYLTSYKFIKKSYNNELKKVFVGQFVLTCPQQFYLEIQITIEVN